MTVSMQTTRVLPPLSKLQAFRPKRFEYHEISITKRPRLIISINEKNYFVEYEDSNDNYLIKDPDSSDEPLILKNNGFIQLGEVKEGGAILLIKFKDAIVIEGGSITGSITVYGEDIVDLILAKRNCKKENDFIRRPEIGSLYDPRTGHVIDGGSNFYSGEHGIDSPIVIVDFGNDVELKKTFERIKEKLKIKEGSTKLPDEESILQEIFLEFNKIEYLSDAKFEKLIKVKKGLNLGPVLFRYGQICRLNAYGVSAITEQSIKKGYLDGKIFYGSQYHHGFPIYKSQSGSFHVVDATQDNFVDLTKNPDATHRGYELVDGKEVYNCYPYKDALTDQTQG